MKRDRIIVGIILVVFLAISMIFVLVGANASARYDLSSKDINLKNNCVRIPKNLQFPVECLCDTTCEVSKRIVCPSSGAIVIEQSTKRVLYQENIHQKAYPASTTKILTALVALNRVSLDKEVVVSREAVGIEGSSIYLKEGEVLTVLDLLYGLMLRSGNDSAVALALAVSNSLDEFADLMNSTAVECGTLNSHFVNPHGLHDDEHYTTAYDLALITAKAFENEDFRRIVSTKQVKIGDGESTRYIANKNKMLSIYDGANGVKTGYTKKSGRCLVSSAKRDGMQLVAVCLNHGGMWQDSITMLDSCFERYSMQNIADNVVDCASKNAVEIPKSFVKFAERGLGLYPLLKDGSERLLIK